MRRTFLPIILLIIGLGLILFYLIQRNSPGRTIATTQTKKLPTVALSEALAQTDDSQGLGPKLATPVISSPTIEPSRTQLPIFPSPIKSTNDSGSILEPVTPTHQAEFEFTAQPCSIPDCLSRFGVSGKPGMVEAAHQAGLPFGAYFNWQTELETPEIDGVEFWQTLSLTDSSSDLTWTEIGQAVDQHPGSTWIVGG